MEALPFRGPALSVYYRLPGHKGLSGPGRWTTVHGRPAVPDPEYDGLKMGRGRGRAPTLDILISVSRSWKKSAPARGAEKRRCAAFPPAIPERASVFNAYWPKAKRAQKQKGKYEAASTRP
jgi:hypothetical protein